MIESGNMEYNRFQDNLSNPFQGRGLQDYSCCYYKSNKANWSYRVYE